MNKGIITCLIAGEYTVYDELTNNYYKGKPRGIFRIKDNTLKVGDRVTYDLLEDKITITKLLDRTNDLIRPQIANVDQAFVVFSVKEPDLNLNLLDRFITILEYNKITPILIFNKWDLLNDDDLREVLEVEKYYSKLGYKVIRTSAKQSLLNQLESFIENKISVITGQSGVGKSSILNVLDPSLKLNTNDISKALNRGKHTTRHVELIKIKNGWIADTPGFGIMEFIDMEETDIAHSFVEFFELSSSCTYSGCLNLNEPKCMVKDGVLSGAILKSRYENYKQFIEEIKKRKKW